MNDPGEGNRCKMRASSDTQRIRHAATVYVEFIRLAVLANDVHFFCTKEMNQRKVPGNLLFPSYLSFNGAKTFSALPIE
jgi:hypothetical protein